MLAVPFFVFGLIVGSFLNAVIFRLHTEESVAKGRSKCMHCKHTLAAWDLVPLFSFLFLGGRCRYCGKKISWQYPLVELATGLMFLALARNHSFVLGTNLFGSLIFGSIFIVIGVYDFKHYLILDKIVFPALALAVVFTIIQDLTIHQSLFTIHSHFGGGVLGAGIISGFFYLQYLVSKGRWIGFGDVKLGLVLGMVAGWPAIIALLFISYVVGAITGIGLIAIGKKHMSSQLPFGAFLTFSAIMTMMYGSDIIHWYLRLVLIE